MSRQGNKAEGVFGVFRFYARLTYCLRGLIFGPCTSFFSTVSVPPTSSGVLPNSHSPLVRDNASSSLWDEVVHNATAIRSRAPVSMLPVSLSLRYLCVFFYLSNEPSFSLFFPFYLLFFSFPRFFPFLSSSFLFSIFSPLSSFRDHGTRCSMGQTGGR